MRITKIVGGLLIALLVVSGCSGGIDGPLIEGNRRSGGTDAIVSGELVIELKCLYLQQTEGNERYPVIWPYGTSWDAQRSAVVLPGGALVLEGVEVTGAGGFHSANLDRFTVQEGVDLALACVDNTYGEIAVFNTSGDITVN